MRSLAVAALSAVLFWVAVTLVILLTSCGSKSDDDEDSGPPKVTTEQLAALESMSASIRQWAPTCGSQHIACEDGEDGDSMLWAGLLCFSGEGQQCVAAMASIGSDGMVGRSPERVVARTENSSSRDMLLGGLVAVTTTENQGKANSILSYIEDHGNDLCEDATDNRCNVNPTQYAAVWGTMRKVWDHIGLDTTQDMRNGDLGDDTIIKLESVFSAAGYAQHLVGVHLLLRRAVDTWNSKTQSAADSLRKSQPNNPFFEFLSQGKTERAAALTLKYCPKSRPASPTQWSWQRDEAEQAWLSSMGWECIFMGNILH